jgi:iron uptake system component EfeO
MRIPRFLALSAAVTLAGGGLAACGKDGGGGADGVPGPTESAPAGAEPIAVNATDTACEVAKTDLAAGTATFAVTNKGNKVTEFYVYGAGERVMGEAENIAPGLTRELRVELPAGVYQTACKPGTTGKGIRGALKVGGAAVPLDADPKLAAATDRYQRYVWHNSGGLLARTQEFAEAVKAGDVARAKATYPKARTYWERIEPVAELFGDLDPRIDGREEVLDEGMQFTGFHRLEKDLWVTGDLSKSGPIADRLVADIEELVTKVRTERLSPLMMANGAKELLDEVATGKITGEEDRYSHTDLWDFHANVEGCEAALDALRPALEERAPELVEQLDVELANVDRALAKHKTRDGWKLHNQLTNAELKELSDVINALAEPVSRVAAVVAK